MARTNDRALTVRLPAALYEQLNTHAVAQDRTVASLLRLLARQYLEESAAAGRPVPSAGTR